MTQDISAYKMTNINKKSVIMSDSLVEKIDITQFYNDVEASIMCKIILENDKIERYVKKIEKKQDEITISFSCNAIKAMNLLSGRIKKIKILETSSGSSLNLDSVNVMRQSSIFIGEDEYDCEITVTNQ